MIRTISKENSIFLKRLTEVDLESTASLWSKLWVDRAVYKIVGISFDQFYPYCLRLCKQALKYDWNCILVQKTKVDDASNSTKERVIGYAISADAMDNSEVSLLQTIKDNQNLIEKEKMDDAIMVEWETNPKYSEWRKRGKTILLDYGGIDPEFRGFGLWRYLSHFTVERAFELGYEAALLLPMHQSMVDSYVNNPTPSTEIISVFKFSDFKIEGKENPFRDLKNPDRATLVFFKLKEWLQDSEQRLKNQIRSKN